MVAFTAARVATKAGTASVARQSNSSTRVMAFAAPSSRMTPAGQSLSKSVAARVSSVKVRIDRDRLRIAQIPPSHM